MKTVVFVYDTPLVGSGCFPVKARQRQSARFLHFVEYACVFLVLFACTATLFSCKPVPVAPEPILKGIPTLDAAQPTDVQIALTNIARVNDGFIGDFDGDGIADNLKLDGDLLWFNKSQSSNPIPILRIKFAVVAYRIRQTGTADFIDFYDKDGRLFVQKSLGLDARGLPYFGPVE